MTVGHSCFWATNVGICVNESSKHNNGRTIFTLIGMEACKGEKIGYTDYQMRLVLKLHESRASSSIFVHERTVDINVTMAVAGPSLNECTHRKTTGVTTWLTVT